MPEIVVTGVGQSGNWLTTVERIKHEVHRKRAVEDDAIKRALISAMRHYRWHRFYFNEGSASMLTQPGVHEYAKESPLGAGNGWPADMLRLDNLHVYNQLEDPEAGNNSNFAYPMESVHFDTMRLWIQSSTSGNRPFWYSWHHDHLFVFPASVGGQHRILFDYLKRLSTPTAQFVAGEWKYFDDMTGAPIDDSYSTLWLIDVQEELIRNRAKADLWANVFYSTEKAQLARGQEQDVLREVQSASHKRLATGHVRPCF